MRAAAAAKLVAGRRRLSLEHALATDAVVSALAQSQSFD